MRGGFRPVAVVPPRVAPVTVIMGATGPRVEGLDVESAAGLLALLR